MRASIATLAAAALFMSAAPGAAKVVLPNGKDAPDPDIACYGGKPGGLAPIFACVCKTPGVCNIGKPCPGGSSSCDLGKNGTCESRVWHEQNGNSCIPKYIDTATTSLVPKRDAAIKPETFRPVCGLTFNLLTRGNAMFKNAFGWYNVVPGKKPNAADLHTLVDCQTSAGTSTPFSLLSNTKYKGGDIGFFLATPEDPNSKGTCAKGNCCATVTRAAAGEGYIYYSEPKINPDYSGSSSYIHLLMFNSKIFNHTFYFSWEDTYNGKTTDFSDFVTSVSGLSCSGAGAQCDTGYKGICAMGLTKCDSVGKLGCEGAYKVGAEAEKCDGLDNDCDGKIDNGATCPANHVCYQGACRPKCYDSEFPCQYGYECDKTSGLCIDSACKGKTCPAGQICRFGKCGSGCEGVTCPDDQLCQAGLCVDPCEGRTCGTAQTCMLGVCLPDCTKCGGVTCPLPLTCDTSTGKCKDPRCATACTSGQKCKGGKCVGLCDGVVCPGSKKCEINNGKGYCPPPGIGTKPATDGGVFPTPDSGVAPGVEAGTQPGVDAGGKTNKPFMADDGCEVAGGAAGHWRPLLPGMILFGLFLLGLARRRDV